MAKEVGQKAVEKQFEIMEEQQGKAQEFIDQKVMSTQMIIHFIPHVPVTKLPFD